MIAIAILLAATLAAAVAGLVMLAVKLSSAKDDAVVSAKLYQDQRQLADEVTVERNEWKRKADVNASQLAYANVKLRIIASQRDLATKEANDATAERIKESTAGVAAGLVNELLSTWPGMPKADPASTGDGDSASDGVPSTAPASVADESSGVSKR